MTADSANLYIHCSSACQRITRSVANLSCFEIGIIVKGYRVVGFGKFCVEAIAQHCARAVNGFFSGLPNQDQRSMPPVFHLGEHLGRAQHGGYVNVVTARMHHAHFLARVVFRLYFAGVRKVGLFIDGQGVELGANKYSWTRAIFHYCNHAKAAPIRMLIPAEVLRDRISKCS